MEKKIKFILSNDSTKHYKIEETSGKFYAYRWKSTTWGSEWVNLGNARSFEDAVTLARADASSFGSIYKTEFD